MKLSIKKKYFEQIKSGEKNIEYRDAHITFVCEGTGEELRRNVNKVELLQGTNKVFPDVLKDKFTICFYLEKANSQSNENKKEGKDEN